MQTQRIALICTDTNNESTARELANRLQLDFLQNEDCSSSADYEFLVMFTPHYLGLKKTSDKNGTPFYLDFLSGKMAYRGKQAGLRKELLARAVGIHPREKPLLIDATAGLGRDSFILAWLGYEVTLLERSPIMHALLEDAFRRAKNDPATAPVIDRMQLINIDSITWLQNKSFDVIYLDPMFPKRQKSASVKKDMVYLQDLLGKDQDANQLFRLALTCATKRVVVKRPRLAENIADQKPNFSLHGKSSRFDIYLASAR